MNRLFGTDGMRGEAGRFPLDAGTIRAAGRSLARQLAARAEGSGPPLVVTGRDTRESGDWIELALGEGLREGGAACESAGVMTTPGVAYLTRVLGAEAGVVVSASHNPYRDNGIKIFAPTGRKMDDATERLIEADIHEHRRARGEGAAADSQHPKRELEAADGVGAEAAADAHVPSAADFGGGAARSPESESGAARPSKLAALYLDFLAEEIGRGLRLGGLRLVVDCANGAASRLAPELLARLGASVTATNDRPDGRNINRECGSLFVERLGEAVVSAGADLGVAYDGDADRALFTDARGQVVDGDATLWVLANYLDAHGQLAGRQVVATVMSNLGLELALKDRGVGLLRAKVGDKYVLEELLATGAALGGEQSGHIILPSVSLAGDGLITTLFLLRAMRESDASLDRLTAGFTRYPQVLVNVRVAEKRPFEEVAEIAAEARRVENELAGQGRLLLRYSGTEPLARVMIEGRGQEEIERLAEQLASVIRRSLGGA